MTAFSRLPRHHFRAIVADPPWHTKNYTPDIGNRDTRRHYRTISVKEIAALPVAEIVAPDCHLFLWFPHAHLLEALEVTKAWGFKYSSIAFTWVKLKKNCRVLTSESDFHVSMGHTTRKSCEYCLIGRRASLRRLSGGVNEVIIAPRREHSRKPDEIYARIEQYCTGPYIELFARQSWPGWKAWGAEVGKFDIELFREAAE
jgi:N6-adenosine-specific RNA methylase IME4